MQCISFSYLTNDTCDWVNDFDNTYKIIPTSRATDICTAYLLAETDSSDIRI